MEFRFDDDQLAVRDAVRAYCADQLDPVTLTGRQGAGTDQTWWQGLAALGVLGMLTPDSAVGMVEASLVFEVLGEHLVSGPVLWSTLAAPLVDGVAQGELRVTGIDTEPGGAGPFVVEHLLESDRVLLVQRDAVALIGTRTLAATPAGDPFDPLTPTAIVASIPEGDRVGGVRLAQQLRRRGAVLAAAMLVGVATGALGVARSYALEREQFDVPIGAFQAVQHLLADMYVRVELAQAATYAAAATEAGRGVGDPEAAAHAAKVLAGDAAVANAHSAIQVLGGMGFTWDMLPHYYLKRAWLLEHTFGTADSHADRLGVVVANGALGIGVA